MAARLYLGLGRWRPDFALVCMGWLFWEVGGWFEVCGGIGGVAVGVWDRGAFCVVFVGGFGLVFGAGVVGGSGSGGGGSVRLGLCSVWSGVFVVGGWNV